MENAVITRKRTARYAGLLYLIWIVSGLFGLYYVPSKINLHSDAITASQNILAHEFLFRTSIINDIVSGAIWVFMVLVLYRLFKPVSERHAKLMVAFVIVQIPAVFIVEALNISTLMLFKGDLLKTFDVNQRQDLAMLFQKINDYLVLSLGIYWGLWLIPLGILVYRSRFIPRFVGIWLLIDGFALLVVTFTGILFPQYKDVVFKLAFPAMLGEVVFMLWLVIKGVKNN